MNNIFEQYGIKDVAEVTLYAIELDENDDEVYIPVLYMDTLKVSTVEESTQSASAQGGIGNPKLITWDYGKDITVTLEDALFTPASSSMNWGAKLGAKKLQLHLRHFFDRNVDDNTPDTCLRTATLTAERFSDFLIIPDRWPAYEGYQSKCSKKHEGYVGGTSIYCWMISGSITSDDTKMRVRIQDLLLFYREQTQRWYFFNGKGPTEDESTWYKTQFESEAFGIHYQYGRKVFEWIRNNIASHGDNQSWNEYETVAKATIDKWGQPENIDFDYDETKMNGIFFLTQNLYIDGYRKGCSKDKLYSQLTKLDIDGINNNTYIPYRYFANIGVEYNTNVVPPQDAIYSIDTALEDVFLLDKMEKVQATRTFCIDTDVNTAHGQYRFLEKYSQTPLTVFIDPNTMQPYLPNTFEYYRENGQRITGNLAVIKKGSVYYKWTRSKAKENQSLGKQIIIDAQHYPGMYRLVGETMIRNRYGEDEQYQFEIPLCKLTPDNRLTLQADGDPTVFTMKLNALRRSDGVMMKLTAYDLIENKCPCAVDKKDIDQFISPNPELIPTPYDGDITEDLSLIIEAAEERDISCEILDTDDHDNRGFKKVGHEPENLNEVAVKISGDINIYSIDESLREVHKFNGEYLKPEQYSATIEGSGK